LALILCAPRVASAGRTFYGWLYGTETLPERGAELMSWLQEENHQDLQIPDPMNPGGTITTHTDETRWWLGPLIGINDQLELALPVEIAWGKADMDMAGHTAFDKFGAELRYRFVTTDPVDAPPIVPLVRVAVMRSITERDVTNPQVDVVVSYQEGIVHVLADLGGYADISPSSTHFELHPGAGVSILALGDLRFGAEIHAELSLDNKATSWAVAGPNFAWSHGRFWISGMYGIGFAGIRDAPRVQWGIAF
jgi:hypothetical protein